MSEVPGRNRGKEVKKSVAISDIGIKKIIF